jgi:RND family efflux transporter MFP subunit
MNPSRSALVLVTVLGLGACAEEAPPPSAPAVRPVKTLLIEGPESGGQRSFPGRVAAARRADLAFRVAGKLNTIPVVEGQRVAEGDTVATLDPTDFQITLNDRKATYDRAKADYDRGRQLVEQGTISRRDFDALTADFKSAEAAFAQAQQNLAYTRLTAPFDGVIARRLMDNFEEVQAKEAIVTLNDISTLEVKVDVPEGLMQRLRRAEPEAQRGEVYALFDTAPGQHFPLTFKEVSTRADPKTQTFEVTLTMAPPQGINVLSGMTTTVVADLSRTRPDDETVTYPVPAGAVVGDRELDPSVWLYDPQAGTVTARKVKVRELSGDRIEVVEGLAPGDRVIVAGASFLAEGMRVRPLPDSEQPERNLR